jgi:hypothetical protein
MLRREGALAHALRALTGIRARTSPDGFKLEERITRMADAVPVSPWPLLAIVLAVATGIIREIRRRDAAGASA